MQPDKAKKAFNIPKNFNQAEFVVWNILGLRYQVSKIKRLENQSLGEGNHFLSICSTFKLMSCSKYEFEIKKKEYLRMPRPSCDEPLRWRILYFL